MDNFKPLFSIIIPCYNSRKTIKNVLQSIVDQRLKKDEIEVIISDDHSTESYDDIIEPFYSKLNLIKIFTDYNYCTGNTRQKGLDIAKGEWITFIDHDDELMKNALVSVKKAIRNNPGCYYIVGDIIHYDKKNKKVLNRMHDSTIWVHGKFYHKENLIDKFNIHFKKDMWSNEDVYFNSLIVSHMIGINGKRVILDDVLYQWNDNEQSLSRKTDLSNPNYCYADRGFIEHIYATSNPYFEAMKLYPDKKETYFGQVVISLIYTYFQIQGLIFNYGNNFYVDDDNLLAYSLLKDIKETFNINIYGIINQIFNMGYEYNFIRNDMKSNFGEYIENETIIDFLMSRENLQNINNAISFKDDEIDKKYVHK